MLVITHATIYTPDRRIDDGVVVVEDGRIARVGPAADVMQPAQARVLDAGGDILAPGFIDLQCNGAFGHDFTGDPASIWIVAAELPRFGVTAFLPTIVTSPPSCVLAAQQVVSQAAPSGFRGAMPLGLHVEGPFLSPQRKGAHNPACLQEPDLDFVAGWSPDTGVRLVTLAPELPGALDVIGALSARGVLVGAGHSTATFEQAVTGCDAGIRYGTHLFNAMPALHHREPGLAGALLTDSRVIVGFIADGVHAHPAVAAMVWRILGPRRLNLVTDAMAALGMPPGRHRLGDVDVDVNATGARLADGTLAGSLLPMDRALRNLMDFAGCSLAEALPAVTSTAAAALRLDHERGRIAPGFVADLVLLSADARVRATIARGEVVYGPRSTVRMEEVV